MQFKLLSSLIISIVMKTSKRCSLHAPYERTWRHLHLFDYPCYIRCRVPRYRAPSGVKPFSVPWARHGCGFTLMFAMQLTSLIQLTHNVEGVARCLAGLP